MPGQKLAEKLYNMLASNDAGIPSYILYQLMEKIKQTLKERGEL